MRPDVVPVRGRAPRARLRWLAQAGAVLALLALCGPVFADEWVRVATDGLGDPSRVQVDALAVYGEDVYIGVHQAAAEGDVSILCAEMRADHVWTDDTPPWGAAGDVTALEIVDGALYAATADGQLWSRGRSTRWGAVAYPWPGTPEILHVAGWDPGDGLGVRLCVLREGPVIACRTRDGTWADLPSVPLSDPSSVESGKLAAYDGDLVAGFGGGSANSRPCEAWRYAPALGWDAITTDGFGGWDDETGGLTWITDLEVFDGRLYFGTGGHTTALLTRLGPLGVEDATPYDLYDCSGFGLCPVRYNALAATPTVLYSGTRTGGLGLPQADVLASDDGLTWRLSNESGFGVELNDTITAMGSRGIYVYAGVFNGGDGFQVWRRNHPFVELIPALYAELWEARLAGIAVLRCLLPFRPCAPPWADLRAPLDEIRLGLDLARHSQDDLAGVKAGIAAMDDVRRLLEDAQGLVAEADDARNKRTGWRLRFRAFKLVLQGVTLAGRTIRGIGVR